jgi:plastocyanin
MKKLFLSILVLLPGITGFGTTWTITNSGFTFSPSTITITEGDDVIFSLEGIHTAVEVSQSTWNANGNTLIPGGFQTSLGGGLVPSTKLGVGTHYYVCGPHSSEGMKGIIIVQTMSGVEDKQEGINLSVYPNPSNNIIMIKCGNSLIGNQFYISDQEGRPLLKGKLTDVTTPIDISQLNSGIYLLQIVDQKKQIIKIVKN